MKYLTYSDDSDISSLEQQLLVSYDANTIRSLVSKLHPKIGKSQTMHLSDQVGYIFYFILVLILWSDFSKWQVPRELAKMIDNLPIPNPTIQVYVYILIAKVRLCLRLNVSHLHCLLWSHFVLVHYSNLRKPESFSLQRMLRSTKSLTGCPNSWSGKSWGRTSISLWLLIRHQLKRISLSVLGRAWWQKTLVCYEYHLGRIARYSEITIAHFWRNAWQLL